jgi:hypothetical protein
MAMDTASEEPGEEPSPWPRPRSRIRRRWYAVAGLLTIALAGVWTMRFQLADHVIAGSLADLKLPARYRIVSIGPTQEVLADIVVGDPAHPDLTIEKLVAETGLHGGVPGIRAVTLTRPRLHGRWIGGRLSFGALDPALFGGPSTTPFRLPDLAVTLVDGRASLATDHGPIGLALSGSGRLRDGFAGRLAAALPQAAAGGCRAGKAEFIGPLTVAGEQPRLTGRLRLAGLACPSLALGRSEAKLDFTGSTALDGGDGKLALALDHPQWRGGQADGATLTAHLSLGEGGWTTRYEATLLRAAAPAFAAATLAIEGQLRAARDLSHAAAEGTISGSELAPGPGFAPALAAARQATAGTLAEPLLAQAGAALLRESRGSCLAGRYQARLAPDATSLVLPEAAITGGSGAALLTLTRFGVDGAGHVAGTVASGGAGLPRIDGQFAPRPDGGTALRLALAPWRAGGASLAVPELVAVRRPNGAIGFGGRALLSGPLPGGAAQGLVLPIEGSWAPGGSLALWHHCAPIGFTHLALGSLVLAQHAVTLCPGAGGAMLAMTGGKLRLAAGASALDLAGTLGGSPVRIASGPVGLAWPGRIFAEKLAVTLGEGEGASHFGIAHLDAQAGAELAGTFDHAAVALAAVPLDITEAAGDWRYAGGKLTLSGAAFRLGDREADARFKPLTAKGASLALADGAISARAVLREPHSGRVATELVLRHDLAAASGSADLAVKGLVFDRALQPEALTPLALGVIANAAGTVTGKGHIAWTPKGVTSNGTFATTGLDFAAAFGPVKQASGSITFTDLLGMVSAPKQQLKLASINPGIEVDDGVLTYRMLPNHILEVDGARWPFLDGTLELLPTRLQLGVSETRRYTLRVTGISAARFLERMEMGNLSATGIFDGSLPLVFDATGGQIVGGALASRAPGGNVAYVGALTYKDLSAMANFAFQTLRSLNYEDMRITMDGAIAGDLVTRISMRGVHQGAGAKSNFLTRQVAKLPLRFDVNVRAPFYQLITSFKSFSDPSFLPDPRGLGLIDAQGRALPAIQPPASEPVP